MVLDKFVPPASKVSTQELENELAAPCPSLPAALLAGWCPEVDVSTLVATEVVDVSTWQDSLCTNRFDEVES